ncbi:MAG TPA: hypothetical protein VLH41_05290, partial [Thermoanaerobaculia bacterium]|nr:hypothetical protein [Thermoanaerobaculia bacterium]
YSSTDGPEPAEKDPGIPAYWIRPPQILRDGPGLHRFVWNLRYPDPPAVEREFPISAIRGATPRGPEGPLVPPGVYVVRLTVDGTTLEQSLEVRMDPRIKTPAEGLSAQLALAKRIAAALVRTSAALDDARARPSGETDRTKLVKEFEKLDTDLVALYSVVESTDAPPTPQAASAVAELEKALEEALSRRVLADGP